MRANPAVGHLPWSGERSLRIDVLALRIHWSLETKMNLKLVSTLLMGSFAILAVADTTVSVFRGKGVAQAADQTKATFQVQVQKVVKGTQTRVVGEFGMTTKTGVLHAPKLRSLAVDGKGAIAQGPAVWSTKVDGKVVRTPGTVKVTGADLTSPKEPTGDKDLITVVFTPKAGGTPKSVTGALVRGDVVIGSKTKS